jgi:hypothetical protein
MKKMYVCGDSWMSPSVILPNTHFSEIISKKLDYNLIAFSRGGMSNGGICIQIESAIKRNADFILVNTTSAERFEIPIKEESKIDTNFDVTDIVYATKEYVSSFNIGFNQNPRLISDCIGLFFMEDPDNKNDDYWGSNRYRKFDKNIDKKRMIIKYYFEHLYSSSWKEKIDQMCLYSIFHKLHLSGIPYLLVLDQLNINKTLPWITEKNVLLNWVDFNKRASKHLRESNNYVWKDPGYHSLPQDQEYAANEILNHIKKYDLLTMSK